MPARSQARLSFVVAALAACLALPGGASAAGFIRTIGTPGDDTLFQIEPLPNGTFRAVGSTTPASGETASWIATLDALGRPITSQSITMPGGLTLGEAHVASAGLVLGAGVTPAGATGLRAFAGVVDSSGHLPLEVVLDGLGDVMFPASAAPFPDGSVLVASSPEGGLGSHDVRITRVATDGRVTFDELFGGTADDVVMRVRPMADGTVLVSAATDSFGLTSFDAWLLDVRPDGSVAWQTLLDGGQGEVPWSAEPTQDGGLLVGGYMSPGGPSPQDGFVVRLDARLNVLWSRVVHENGQSMSGLLVTAAADGGAFAIGSTATQDPTSSDIVALRFNAVGDLTWQRRIGGTADDEPGEPHELPGGDVIFAGTTASMGAGGTDGLVVRLDTQGNVSDTCGLVTPGDASVTPASFGTGTVLQQPTATTSTTSPGDAEAHALPVTHQLVCATPSQIRRDRLAARGLGGGALAPGTPVALRTGS